MNRSWLRRGCVVALPVALVSSGIALGRPAMASGSAPALTGLRVAGPASVDVTSKPNSVGVTLRFTGGDSGLDSAAVTATCVTGCASGATPLTAAARYDSATTSGSPSSGAITLSLAVPQTASAGTWRISSVVLGESDGDTTTYADADLSSYPSRTFTVTKTADSAGPTVGAVSFPNGDVNVTTADADIDVKVHLTDATAGVDHGQIVLSKVGNDSLSRVLAFDVSNLTTGTAQAGDFEVVTPGGWTYTDAGQWTVQSVDAVDAYGNSTHVSPVPSAPTLTVTASPDTAPPAASNVGLTATSVNVTTGPATVTLTLRITDAVSGFKSGHVTLTDGVTGDAGIAADIGSDDRTTGDSRDGTYSVSIKVPARQPAGMYSFTGLDLTDRYGNTGPGATLSGLPTLAVTATADNSPPALTGLSVAPATVNLDGSEPVVSVIAHATDATSGVSSIDVTLTDSASTATDVVLDASDLVSGTSTDGTYAVAQPVSGFAVGHVTVTAVAATDVAGQAAHYTAGQVPSPASAGFTIVNQPGDTTAPSLSSLSLTPAAVSTTDGPAAVTVTAHAIDTAPSGVAPTGVRRVTVTLTPPVDGNPVTATLRASDISSGSPLDETVTGHLTIPRFAPNGQWTVTDVTVTDGKANAHDYSGGSLAAISTATVQVSGPTDTAAPALTGFTSPASVNTTDGSHVVPVTVSATDTDSGVCSVTVTATSPSGQQSRHATVKPAGTGSGDCPHSATVSPQLRFDSYDEAGNWKYSIDITDGAGHTRHLDATDLAAASVPAAIAVTPSTDTHAPTVAGLSFDPSPVDVTSAATAVVINVHLTDTGASNGSGVASASIIITEPDGVTSHSSSLSRVGGTATDGYYQGSIVVPRFAATGQWPVSDLSVSDTAGNTADLDSTDLTGAGLPGALTVTGTSDTTAPGVSSIEISPNSVDITGHDGLATVQLQLTDAGSGVAGASFDLIGPDNTDLVETTGAAPSVGTRADGTWAVPVDIPAYSAIGAWHIDNLMVTDQVGNELDLTQAQIMTAGLGDTLTVTGSTDSAAPVLTALSFSPSPVDVSNGPHDVTVTAHITDDASGFATGTITVSSPSGHEQQVVLTPPAGCGKDCTVTATLPIKRYAEAGTWTVTQVDLTDLVGHEATHTVQQLPSGSIAKSFTVVDSNADTAAPLVTGISVSRATVSVAGGQSDEQIRLHVTDALSGVASVALTVTDPDGHDVPATATLQPGGTPQSGTWSADIPIPASAARGTWTVTQVIANDSAGNTAVLTGSNVPATKTFVVAGAPVKPGAPTGLTVTPAVGQATVSFDAPIDDGGEAPTGYDVTVSPAPTGGAGTRHVTAPPVIVTGLASGKTYTFSVVADNTAGAGTAAAVTLHGGQFSASKPAATVPGQKVKVTTTLTDVDTKKPVAGVAVQLLQRGSGGTFAPVGSATTDSKGVASRAVTPSQNTTYQWVYAGKVNARAAVTGQTFVVSVASIVTAAAKPASVKHGKPLSIYGTVTPGVAGQVVHLQQLVGKKWHTLSSHASLANQKLPNGKTALGYVIKTSFSHKGRLTLRTTSSSTAANAAGTSKAFTVKVT